MAIIRFKDKFNEDIRNPKPIKVDGVIGDFKSKTTRNKPRKVRMYEVVNSLGSLYKIKKTGILIKLTCVEKKAFREYTEHDILCDVGHCDLDRFIREVSEICRKKFTKDTIGYLHTFELPTEDEAKAYWQAEFVKETRKLIKENRDLEVGLSKI